MDRTLLRKLTNGKELDAIVAVSPENVHYSTGACISTQKTIRDRLAYAVFPAEGEPTFIVCGIEESLVREESWIRDIRTFVEFQQAPTDMLVDVLREKGLAGKKVGIEVSYLAASYWETLRERLPGTTFEECKAIFDHLRMIKEPWEIELLTHGAVATLKAITAAFALASPGNTEKEVADNMIKFLIDMGASGVRFIHLASGERSQLTHPTPGPYRLKKGDIVRVDFGCPFSGYNSDVARTLVVGPPTPRQKDMYAKLIETQKAIIDNCKVGIRACDLYFLCRDKFAACGLDFTMPHIGHSIGLQGHEPPMIRPFNTDPLEENMIINIEPLGSDGNKATYHTEDLVWITREGPKVLTGTSFSPEIGVIS